MRALLVVDTQRDFCEGGSLAVKGGKDLAKRIYNDLLPISFPIPGVIQHRYGFRLATKDFHNPFTADSDNHGHFSKTPNFVNTWPAHCVQNTGGANFMSPLSHADFNDTFKKGRGIPAYSGFQGVGTTTKLTLDEFCRTYGIDTLDICGIALDYCVKATVEDALKLNYQVNLLSDYTVAVDETLRPLVLHHLQGLGAQIG